MKLEHRPWSRIGLLIALILAHLSFTFGPQGLRLLPLQLNPHTQPPAATDLSGLTSHDVFRALWAAPEWQSSLDSAQKERALQLSKALAELIDDISIKQLTLQQNLAEAWNEHH